MIHTLASDLRLALRGLRSHKAYALIALLTLALGIGATTAMFSAVNAVLLRPLPFADPDELVWISNRISEFNADLVGGADFIDWRDTSRSLRQIAAFTGGQPFTLTGRAEPERIVGTRVSAGFLPLLGTQPSAGRAFTEDDVRANAPPVAMLTARAWERLFGSGVALADQTIVLDGTSHTIVGILPAAFLVPQAPRVDVLLPLVVNEPLERSRQQMSLVNVIGRLAAGVTPLRARDELARIRADAEAAARAARTQSRPPGSFAAGPPSGGREVFLEMPVPPPGGPEGRVVEQPAPPAGGPDVAIEMPPPPSGPGNVGPAPGTPPPGAAGNRVEIIGGPGPGPGRMLRDSVVSVTPLRTQLVGETRPALLLLLATVAGVLLITCANVASLVLARASGRAHELTVRAALGARRRDLVRHLFTESLVVAALGGLAGVVLAQGTLAWLVARIPPDVSSGLFRQIPVGIDRPVLAFAAAVTILSCFLFASGPALVSSRVELGETLKVAGGFTAGSRQRRRFRSLLVIGEVALAVVLLVGAGLVVRSFVRLLSIDPGFHADRVVTVALDLGPRRYPSPPAIRSFFERVAERVQGIAGVQEVAWGDTVPLRDYSMVMMGLNVEGRPPEPGRPPEVAVTMVSPAYFDTMGIRVLRGRPFADSDREGALPVAIVNQSMSRRLWGSEDVVGKRFRFGPRRPDWITVVGVAADVRHEGLDAEPRVALYRPFLQDPQPFGFLAVRSSIPPASLVADIRRAVQQIDPALAVYDAATMEARLADSMAARRFALTVLTLLAALALVLSAVGLYGVLTSVVGERTREIGVRMALGARPRDVLVSVVGHGLALAGAGVAIGITAALLMSPVLAGSLFGIGPRDLATFAVVPLLLVAVALLAMWVPARRAVGVDPLVALREE